MFHKLVRNGWLPTLIVLSFLGVLWVAVELAEALEPIVHGIVDRIDHVIEYEAK